MKKKLEADVGELEAALEQTNRNNTEIIANFLGHVSQIFYLKATV